MTDRTYFEGLADYNAWANGQLYDAAAALDEAQRRRDLGVFFKDLHGTLAHLVATDNAWMCLLQGRTIERFPAEATTTFNALRRTREALDLDLKAMVRAMSPADFDAVFAYSPWAGDFVGLHYRQPRRDTLAHVFNHQTHHRGQAHTALSLLGVEPPALDLVVMHLKQGAA